MSLIFDAFPRDVCRTDEDRVLPRPAGVPRLALAFCLIGAIAGALEFASRQPRYDAATLAAYEATQQGDVR